MKQIDLIEKEILNLKRTLDQAISRGETFGSVKKIYVELKALQNLIKKQKPKH